MLAQLTEAANLELGRRCDPSVDDLGRFGGVIFVGLLMLEANMDRLDVRHRRDDAVEKLRCACPMAPVANHPMTPS